ncbi:MAG: hypothetical protein DRI57_31255 [Deltaproteobacteria bacterium]|nr:MAG: hypothetical protein DRI57_31255 [Deltaproteobacteria bacterium]
MRAERKKLGSLRGSASRFPVLRSPESAYLSRLTNHQTKKIWVSARISDKQGFASEPTEIVYKEE